MKNVLLPLLIVSGASLLTGCAEVSLLSHAASEVKDMSGSEGSGTVNRGRHKVGKPYQVDNIWYYPKEDPGYSETGIASWYGEPFHGRRTANGAVYDMNQLTAAHKTLPMPTDVRVTNLENGRSIVVTVNDRGPFVHGRIIDLSRRSAQLLGIIQKGTAKVRVEMANPGGNDTRFIAKTETSAEEKRNVTAAPMGEVQTASLNPPPGRAAQTPPATQSGTAVEALPAPQGDTAAVAPPATGVNSLEVAPVQPTEIFIQAGAFVDFDNANKLSARLSSLAATKVTQVLVNGQDFYRVRIGPVDNVADADQLLARLLNSGHTEARIVIE
ncbi:septal ring lytic transglycosylase RlpA family protein [Sneathiella chinensis]|uniref:Endolytic peptidoglycan transglycosylase RlpA n=1 Tax=Sneathiella chinensis TaxID=349750 RepID=A0ABQ5U7M3_9PROT|nr:septal ring lytic transglycosylase RlpA family protein [Sneathiella chinensis]GLQ07269.1 hypothetical protein GCM10007924_24900 [Sneathiella chinensis]